MAEVYASDCPACRRPIVVTANAGQRFPCPLCQAMLVLEPPANPAVMQAKARLVGG